MEKTCFDPVLRVAICGGTHGNELTGVYIVRELQKQKMDKLRPVSVTTVLTNPRATDACRRYMEMDLNRCFTNALLRTGIVHLRLCGVQYVQPSLSSPTTDTTPYEVRRAQELNTQLGPKGSEEAVDLLIDLHNTTANMGLTLIFYSLDWITLHIYKYIQSKMTQVPVRALQLDVASADAYSLESVGKHGFAIEVGPQPNGVLRADIFNMMKSAVDLTLTWLQEFNSGHTFEGGEVEAFTSVKSVDYPRGPAGEITAAIHPELQDNDFQPLRSGDPVFLSFSGEMVKHEGEEFYPLFVNECAYYEKKIAFHLARRTTFTLPSIGLRS